MTLEKFHYMVGKKKITLPLFSKVFTNIGEVRRLSKEPVANQIFAAVEKAADEKTLEVIDSMTVDEFNEFATAWQKNSGVGLGESEASADS